MEESKRNIAIDLPAVGLDNLAYVGEFVEHLVGNMSEGVIILNEQREIKGCSRKFLDIVGKTDPVSSVINQNVDRFFGDLPALLASFEKQFDEGEETYSIPYVKLNTSVVKVRGVRLRRAKLFILTEITGLIQARTQLESEKQANTMKDDFLNIAAHDLRGPAGAVRGFLARVMDGDAGEVNAKASDLIKDAYEGNRRLINLINDFLTVSRLQHGKVKMIPKVGDLTSWVETVVKEESVYTEEKKIYLKYDKSEIPSVFADEDRIIEVLTNLVGNAIKFTDTGGITISHELSEGFVVTHVSDTGSGISKERQKYLFMKFYVDSRHTRQSGLGLGLYISKLIVGESGGKIWIDSDEGKGTRFSFSIPVAG